MLFSMGRGEGVSKQRRKARSHPQTGGKLEEGHTPPLAGLMLRPGLVMDFPLSSPYPLLFYSFVSLVNKVRHRLMALQGKPTLS